MGKLGVVSVVSLSLSFFFMAFEHEYRIYAYVSLVVFILVSVFSYLLVRMRRISLRLDKKVYAVLIMIGLLCLLQVLVSYYNHGLISFFDLSRVFYSLFILCGVLISLVVWGQDWYSKRLCYSICLLSLLAFVLYGLDFYLDSMNFYASMLLIPSMYTLMIGKKKLFLVLSLFTVGLGLIFEARGAYLVMILFMLVFGAAKFMRLTPLVMLSGLLFLLGVQFLLLDSQTLYADELLSYRPTIWKYYYSEALDSFWFGNGPILTFISEGAASYYQFMIGRGVGVSYGTQSMYVLYFYESGVVGIVLLLLILYVVFLTRSKYLVPVFAIAVLAFLETVKVGAVSIYGLPLTYFIAMSLVSKEKSGV